MENGQLNQIKLKEKQFISQRDVVLEEMGQLKLDQKWIDWINEFGNRIDKLRTEELSTEVRNKFLKGVIKEIVVNSTDKHSHEINIIFNMNYVEDKYIRTNLGKYKILDGKDKKVVTLKKVVNQ